MAGELGGPRVPEKVKEERMTRRRGKKCKREKGVKKCKGPSEVPFCQIL